jgi:hypothetical protein
MGDGSMNWLNTVAILVAAFFAVFVECGYRVPRIVLGAQPDLLPSLMAYAALSCSLFVVGLLAVCGGLWLDSLSANPLGISVLPLFLAGAAIHYYRALILRDQWVARWLTGLGASAAVPVLTWVLLLLADREPLWGWWSLWQWTVLAVGGAVFTPVWFFLFDRLHGALHYQLQSLPSFRPDRDIKRGR